MPLETVYLEFIDNPFWDETEKTIRNLNVRLRLKQNFADFPKELLDLWVEFFELWKGEKEMTSDRLLAMAQKMFEIESYLSIVTPKHMNPKHKKPEDLVDAFIYGKFINAAIKESFDMTPWVQGGGHSGYGGSPSHGQKYTIPQNLLKKKV
jgi:hypothetical protein